jgi:pyruvate/2-oxoglutarate dehydrogenase complex dihydrolipoamide dehydrogenase (E3) component
MNENAQRRRVLNIRFGKKNSGPRQKPCEGEDTGMVKMLLDIKGKPLGVQILGPHAGELVSEWVAALNGGVKLSTLAGAVHPYPTLAEINKKVVGNYFSGRIFSDKVKKTLKFLFNLKGRACEEMRCKINFL